MVKYIFKRILMMIPVVIGVITIVFILTSITPGDPAEQIAGVNASAEVVETIREELGLNEPLVVRYVKYIWGIFTRGDLGISYTTKQPILDEILVRYPTTIKLAFLSVLISVCIGIPLGVISAVYQHSWLDNITMAISLIGVSMPQFWLGLLGIILFSTTLGWLPSSGIATPSAWILPSLTIGVCSSASIARTTRSSMLDVIRQDYIRTAKAKGQAKWVIAIKHALRSALIPIITIIGAQFGIQLGGTIMIESVFAIPGLGKFMVDAIKARNYPAVQGGVVFLAIVFSFVNLIVDIVYAFVDPKIGDSIRKNGKKGK